MNWEQYFVLLGFLVIVYWMVVGLAFYRREIKDTLADRKGVHKDSALPGDSPFERPAWETQQVSLFREEGEAGLIEDGTEAEDGRFKMLYTLAEEVRSFIRNAGGLGMARGELLQGLRSLIGQEIYQELNVAEYRVAINNLVAVESEEQCGIHFDAGELNMIWSNFGKP